MMNSRQKGSIGVAQAIVYFTMAGYTISVPISEAQRYDLIIERDGILQRVEVKTTFYRKREHRPFEAHMKTCGGNQVTTYLNEKDCELVFIWCGDGTNYLFPTEVVAGYDKIYLSNKWDEYKI
jgi:hypothetical protein